MASSTDKTPSADISKALARIKSHPTLTPFRRRVYRTLLSVPASRWTTYAALARHLSSSPRAIGAAMKSNPFAPAVPCHRVLAADRSLGGYKGAWNNGGEYAVEKTKLLVAEGVQFDGDGKAMGPNRKPIPRTHFSPLRGHALVPRHDAEWNVVLHSPRQQGWMLLRLFPLICTENSRVTYLQSCKMRLCSSLLLIFLASHVAAQPSPIDYSQYVNAFIGSEGPTPGQAFGGGDIFVGGARPFGVVKFGVDTTAANWTLATLNGGWTPDGNVTAFTMMHESGTGGAPKYGIIPQMPLTSVDAPVNLLENLTYAQPRVGNDTASVGYFRTTLQNGVVAELSASRHAGIINYSFPSGEKYILVDVSHYLPGSPGDTSSQFYVAGEIKINREEGSYEGYGTYVGGFNNGAPYTVYFYGEFSLAPQESTTFSGANTSPMPRYQNLANGGIPEPVYGNQSTNKATSGPLNSRVGALFRWNNSPESTQNITSRIGISFISTAKAKSYIASEIPSWNLNDTVADSVHEWNTDVFSKIRVPVDDDVSTNITNLRLLYSSLYFMHLMPSDRSGENPLWVSEEPFWDDFYTLCKLSASFLHVGKPTYYESMIRGIIDIFRHQGYLPDGRSGNWNGLVQGGSDADNVLADAYIKGLRGSINWPDAYAAMLKNAEVTPYNTFDPTDLTGSTKEGRGALDDWLELGYVAVDHNSRCISRTVEYSLNDFALSQVASGIEPRDQQKYLNRSAGWQLIWNREVTSLGFTGFLAPRYANGSFEGSAYDPLYCGGCEWSSITYEGVPWEYSFVIPHDVETLIEFMGGSSTFESRLDLMFVPGVAKQDLGANGAGITTLMNIGNEPDFATPYLYHYINKQAKSVQQSRNLSNTYFKDAAYGIPGNSDAGAMNSWLLWQLIGLYPIVTQPIYLIGSPWFPDINMTVNVNQTLRITASGLDYNRGSYYVQSVRVNGQAWDKNWLTHEDVFVHGGSIEFVLGTNMTAWETGGVPPSPGHVTL
ncbi:hypothetical protein UA08_06477 [Talaromyces atroroseus]|uniref:Methylated-DNA--protein-cysteine methyltransferase n=1 Tax=Talaromyces atroroseus TaxID=1441469 RepID=A0A225AAV9_TALAT|nr:hypothetical protein UA08_06477 [Talaromyces atroroseus]OKL58141.1 hypothetical protein UA08_06477 [Talaromyces atroroseus]